MMYIEVIRTRHAVEKILTFWPLICIERPSHERWNKRKWCHQECLMSFFVARDRSRQGHYLDEKVSIWAQSEVRSWLTACCGCQPGQGTRDRSTHSLPAHFPPKNAKNFRSGVICQHQGAARQNGVKRDHQSPWWPLQSLCSDGCTRSLAL